MNHCGKQVGQSLPRAGLSGKELTVKGQKETSFGDKIFYIAIVMVLLRFRSTLFKTHQVVFLNCAILMNANFTSIKQLLKKNG